MITFQEFKNYATIIKNMSASDAFSILKAYGDWALIEFRGLPESGVGIMTRPIYLHRKEKCDKCPLKDGNVCSTVRYRQHLFEKDENGNPLVVPGCGCGLAAKQITFEKHCPAGEW